MNINIKILDYIQLKNAFHLKLSKINFDFSYQYLSLLKKADFSIPFVERPVIKFSLLVKLRDFCTLLILPLFYSKK